MCLAGHFAWPNSEESERASDWRTESEEWTQVGRAADNVIPLPASLSFQSLPIWSRRAGRQTDRLAGRPAGRLPKGLARARQQRPTNSSARPTTRNRRAKRTVAAAADTQGFQAPQHFFSNFHLSTTTCNARRPNQAPIWSAPQRAARGGKAGALQVSKMGVGWLGPSGEGAQKMVIFCAHTHAAARSLAYERS